MADYIRSFARPLAKFQSESTAPKTLPTLKTYAQF